MGNTINYHQSGGEADSRFGHQNGWRVDTYSFDTIIDPADIPGSKAATVAAVKRLRTEAVAEAEAHTAVLDGWSAQLDAALDAWEAE